MQLEKKNQKSKKICYTWGKAIIANPINYTIRKKESAG
jgi:hypothetical protein